MRVDLLVVGAGPAGLMAGVQAVRGGLRAVVVERDRPGGAVHHARWMENVPGFPDGVAGRNLAPRLVAHAERFAVPVVRDEVLAIDRAGSGFVVRARDASWEADAVLVATGARPVPLDVPGEAERAGLRVFHHADEVPAALAGGDWLVAGGGDVAFDQALALAPAARSVRLLVRGDAVRAVRRLVVEARERSLPVLFGRRVVGIGGGDPSARSPRSGPAAGPGHRGRLVVRAEGPGGREEMEADGLLVCVGKRPERALLPDGALPDGAEPAGDLRGATAIPGLYVAGDARRGFQRQVAIAAGDGLAAAMEVARRRDAPST